MRTFTVKRLAVQTTRYTEHDVILCAYLADSADLSGETFMFQQNLAGHDEQDRELGQDTYCLTTSPGQATHYGGITRYHFDGKALTLYLDGDAGRFYGTEGIRFDLQVPTRSIAILRKALPRLFPDVLHAVSDHETTKRRKSRKPRRKPSRPPRSRA